MHCGGFFVEKHSFKITRFLRDFKRKLVAK
jgi:hypothetical protein